MNGEIAERTAVGAETSWFVHVDLEVSYEESATYSCRVHLSTCFSFSQLKRKTMQLVQTCRVCKSNGIPTGLASR
jgi:hypothetical protein